MLQSKLMTQKTNLKKAGIFKVSKSRISLQCLILLLIAGTGCSKDAVIDYDGPTAGWPTYGNSPGGGHYTAANQITAENVHLLEQAWVYRSGDSRSASKSKVSDSPKDAGELPLLPSGFQATAIIENETLYFCTPFNRVIALDPETGKERWTYDPKVNTDKETHTTCRGVSSWRDKRSTSFCAHRIITGTIDGRLIALDGKTGQPCKDFGVEGTVNLKTDLKSHTEAEHSINSPPAIIGDLVVTGATVIDSYNTDVPSGVVRAYDIRTGKLVWDWDPVPPGKASETKTSGQATTQRDYRNGTANVWSIMSVDQERELIFVPTGNASPDYFGGHRGDLDYYSSAVVALKAKTGEVAWHFQTVHHDIWDYDTPSQPTLYDIVIDGKPIPALAQPTKMGHLFLLNRETGEPLYPVEERPVPQNPVAGEFLSPTQPFPTKPAPLYKTTLTVEDAWGLTPWDKGKCRDIIQSLRHEGLFTPPSLEGTINYPGPSGTNNWGAPAIDPERKIAVLNANHLPWKAQLIPRDQCKASSITPQQGTPYCVEVSLVASPLGVPCSAPPWGTLTGVDLKTGEKIWDVPLGSIRDLNPLPLDLIEGSPTVGGPLVTGSGLTFIGASSDYFLRAFKTETGEEIWRTRLPTTANSTPMSYRLKKNSRQYIVIAVGGHWGFLSPVADYLMAFALPEDALPEKKESSH